MTAHKSVPSASVNCAINGGAMSKSGLTRCAEELLLAREVLKRNYFGHRERNDTERLEKLFELYTKMTKKGA